jgi:hypothetical protein
MTAPWIALQVALSVLVLVIAVVLLGLLRRILPVLEAAGHAASHRHEQAGGLAPGTRLPNFEVVTREGEVVHAADLRGRAAVVLLVSAGCHPCDALIAELTASGGDGLAVPLLVIDDADATVPGPTRTPPALPAPGPPVSSDLVPVVGHHGSHHDPSTAAEAGETQEPRAMPPWSTSSGKPPPKASTSAGRPGTVPQGL